MALEYQFLMDQLLAVAGFHLASLHPDRRQFYFLQASQHQSHAVRGMRTALAEITAENCHALFASSALLVIGGYAAVTTQSEGPKPTVEDILDIFLLTRGVHSVLSTSEDLLSKGPFQELFSEPRNPTSVPPAGVRAVIDRLTTLGSRITAHNLDTNVAALAEAGALSLVECVRSATATLEMPDIRIVSNWATYLDADFITLLRQGHPAAMIILAYFCVILRTAEANFWYIRAWGFGVVTSIERRLEPSWRDLVEWPLGYISAMETGPS